VVDEHNLLTPEGNLRSEMRLQNLWHRTAFIIVRHVEEEPDVQGDDNFVLVQLRLNRKDDCPNVFDPAPGGIVGFGDLIEEEMAIVTLVPPDNPKIGSQPEKSIMLRHCLLYCHDSKIHRRFLQEYSSSN